VGLRLGIAGIGKYLLVGIALVILSAAGCSNYVGPNITNGPANNSLNIVLLPTGTIPVDVGTSVTIQAFVLTDPTNGGVKWSLSGPGTLTNATTSQVTYTAPSSNSVAAASITATENADATQFSTAILDIKLLPTFTTTTVANGTVGTAYSSPVTIANGAAPFTLSIASGALPPGLALSPQSLNSFVLSGSPTTAGSFNFTVKVTDSTAGSATQQFSVTIAAAGTSGNALRASLSGSAGTGANVLPNDGTLNATLHGSYVLTFNGFSGADALSASGTLELDGNGNVTNGSIERTVAGAQSTMAFAGTYALGANHLGAMILNFADGSSATYAIAAASDGSARFIEFDDTTGLGTRGAGQLSIADIVAQPPTDPALNGIYAGATGAPTSASDTEYAATFSFDGSGNVSATIALSGPSGLDILATQTGTYSVNGNTVTISGISVNGVALQGTVLSSGKISVVVQDAQANPAIILQK
jgi:hypothetical protein